MRQGVEEENGSKNVADSANTLILVNWEGVVIKC